jgi:hypothetical protein
MRSTFGNSLMVAVLLLFVCVTVKAETFTVYINGAQEVPASGSTATGYGRIFLDESAGTISFTIVYSGLSSNQTLAHIHAPGVIGVNGPPVVTFISPGGTSGTISGSSPVTPTLIAQMRAHQAYINIHSVNFPGGEIRGQIASRRVLDYDGDGITDYSVLRFPNVAPPGVSQITYWNRNSQGLASNQTVQWGDANRDFPCPGDYDGDAKDDFCVYRAGAAAGQQSFFIITRSSDLGVRYIPFGLFGDQAVNRDYDGDGITDIAVFRRGPSANVTTRWFILQSSNQAVRLVDFGLTGNTTNQFDSPVPGDYDGDGKFDIAVYRFGLTPANNFIVLRSSDSVVTYRQFGNFNSDYIVPGDYDGDGKFDYAVARTGASGSSPLFWFILQSSNGQFRSLGQFGITSDVPTQGDYDGDGVTDIAVYRAGATGAAQSTFHALGSFNGYILTPWGLGSDFAVNTFDAR